MQRSSPNHKQQTNAQQTPSIKHRWHDNGWLIIEPSGNNHKTTINTFTCENVSLIHITTVNTSATSRPVHNTKKIHETTAPKHTQTNIHIKTIHIVFSGKLDTSIKRLFQHRNINYIRPNNEIPVAALHDVCELDADEALTRGDGKGNSDAV